MSRVREKQRKMMIEGGERRRSYRCGPVLMTLPPPSIAQFCTVAGGDDDDDEVLVFAILSYSINFKYD